MLLALVLLLYVGGVEAQAEYARYAARGDSDVPAPVAVSASLSDEPVPDQPAPFTAPVLNGGVADGQVVGAISYIGFGASILFPIEYVVLDTLQQVYFFDDTLQSKSSQEI